MKTPFRRFAVRVLAPLCLAAAAAAAPAAEYPARPIRMIVPELSGSGSDIVSRLLAGILTEAWGTNVVVDNRPGASGMIAAELVSKAAPDGYTLWPMSLSHLVGGVLFNRHLVADEFTPITLSAQTTSIFAVHAALPVNSVAELIAYAKARPGEVNFGSAGNVTSMHLCMEMLRAATGVNVVHVPFKGASAMLTDLAGGRVQAACVPVAPVQPFIKSGRLRGLGVTSLTRTNLAPGLPPVAETVPGFEMNGWYGLVAPRGTPPAIVAKIHGALARGLKSPAVVEKLAGMGVEPVASTPAEFAAFLKAQTPKWRKLLQDANITAN